MAGVAANYPNLTSDEFMIRQLAIQMMEKAPIEMLEALFKFTKLDPNSKESMQKMFTPFACDYVQRDYLIHLRDMNMIEFSLDLNLEMKQIPNKG